MYRKSRIPDSSITLDDLKKQNEYNRNKQFDKSSFDSDILNTSQSIRFQNSKWFAYKRSRIDKLVIRNIWKVKEKEDKAILKKIKEIEKKLTKQDEIVKLNEKVRLKNAKKSKKTITRKQNENIQGTFRVYNFILENTEPNPKTDNNTKTISNHRAWRDFFEVK